MPVRFAAAPSGYSKAEQDYFREQVRIAITQAGTLSVAPPTSNDFAVPASTGYVQQALGMTNVQNAGAVGDGETDDTNALQQAIAQTPSGIVWFAQPKAFYKIKNTLVVSSPYTRLEGSLGATIQQTGTDANGNDLDHIWVNASDCQIVGLQLVGNGNADGTGANGNGILASAFNGGGADATQGNRLTVERCKFRNLGVAAVDIMGCTGARIIANDINGSTDETGTTSAKEFQGIWVRADFRLTSMQPLYAQVIGNNVRHCDNEGIILALVGNCTVSSNQISDCYAGIALYSSPNGDCVDNTVSGNVITSLRGVNALAGIWLGHVGGTSLHGGRTRYNSVTGNTIDTSPGYGIGFGPDVQQAYPTTAGTSATAAAGSTATTLNGGTPGWTANVYAGQQVTIAGGTGSGQTRLIYSNTSSVLSISNGLDGIPWGTTPDATSTYQILDPAHSDNTVTANLCRNSTKDGILGQTARSVISGNVVDTAAIGINASWAYSISNTITNNDVRNCSSDGIKTTASPNTILGNYAELCGGYLFNLEPSVCGGSRYANNRTAPITGTSTFSAGADQTAFYGGPTIQIGPSGVNPCGILGFGIAYDGTNWRNRNGLYGGLVGIDPSDGQLTMWGVNTSAVNSIVTPAAALKINAGGGSVQLFNTPTAPTAANGTNTTQVATMAAILANTTLPAITSYAGVATTGIGMPSLSATSDKITQNAALSNITLIAAAPTDTQYAIFWRAVVTQAATSSSTLGGSTGFTVTYTDVETAASVTTVMNPVATATGNTVGTQINDVVFIRAKSGTAVTYSFGYTSSGATVMKYALLASCVRVS